MPEYEPSKAEELIEKALGSLPPGSSGRLAVLACASALVEVRIELRLLREALSPAPRPKPIALESNGLGGELPPGITKLSACRTCEAPVYWCHTRSGKRMPVDAVPSPDGTMGIDADGVVGKRTGGPRYTSHFATCPDADKHRNPRESASQ